MPASRFLKIVQEPSQIPVCRFYLPVSTTRNHTVCVSCTVFSDSGTLFHCFAAGPHIALRCRALRGVDVMVKPARKAFWNPSGVANEPVHWNPGDVDPGSVIISTNPSCALVSSEWMVHIKQNRGIGVEIPLPGSFLIVPLNFCHVITLILPSKMQYIGVFFVTWNRRHGWNCSPPLCISKGALYLRVFFPKNDLRI